MEFKNESEVVFNREVEPLVEKLSDLAKANKDLCNDQGLGLELEKEEIFQKKLLENEILSESYQIQSESDFFRESLENLKGLLKEEDNIVEKFLEMMNEANSLERAQDIFESLLFELNIRKADKLKVLENIKTKEEHYQEMLRSVKGNLEKVQQELSSLKKYQETRIFRHHGKIKTRANESVKDSDMYDWIVDIDSISNVTTEGWKIYLKRSFNEEKTNLFRDGKVSVSREMAKWNGSIVAVVGLYDKGKTFVLNNLTGSNLPSGKKVNTKGLSFKSVDVDSGTNMILLDTAGSYSPVRIISELSVIEKEAREFFIMDLVFELSDYFICVVNDFTSLDQRYLDKLTRNLQNSSSKSFREVIVIHNLKEVENQEILDHLWDSQVTMIYGQGSVQRTKVAAINPLTKKLQEKHVVWFKTNYSRHIYLANDDCPLGANVNPWTFSLLKYWIKAVFVPVNRQFSVMDSVISCSNIKLSSYFKTNINLIVENTADPLIKIIKAENKFSKELRVPQISIDSSGFITTSPDSFLPNVDIIKSEDYTIFLEVPGMSKEEVMLTRQNVMTIVKGVKRRPYQKEDERSVERNERKYGEFHMTFKIPENYERKWYLFEVENGVVKISYKPDKNEIEEMNTKEPSLSKKPI